MDPKDPSFGKLSLDSGTTKLDPSFYGFTASDYERKFKLQSSIHKVDNWFYKLIIYFQGFLGLDKEWTLKELLDKMK